MTDTQNNDDAPDLGQLVTAVAATATHPDLPTIMNDINLVLRWVKHVREGNMHPTAVGLLKSLL